MRPKQCSRGLLPDRAMRALLIVVPAPSLDDVPDLGQRGEDVLVEAFVKQAIRTAGSK